VDFAQQLGAYLAVSASNFLLSPEKMTPYLRSSILFRDAKVVAKHPDRSG
jgi:hypothetical protein